MCKQKTASRIYASLVGSEMGLRDRIAPGIRTEKFIQGSFEVGNDDTMHGTSSRSVRLILTESKAKAIPENGPLSGPETPLGKGSPSSGDNTVPELALRHT